MKRFLASIGLLLALTGTAAVPAILPGALATNKTTTAGAVYMCANGKTEVYHGNRDCVALRRCSHEVRSLTASQAQANGLRGCMKCY